MMMVRVSETTWVSVADIETIVLNILSCTATVWLRNGVGHQIDRDPARSLAETVERLVEKINHCKEAMHGHSQD